VVTAGPTYQQPPLAELRLKGDSPEVDDAFTLGAWQRLELRPPSPRDIEKMLKLFIMNPR